MCVSISIPIIYGIVGKGVHLVCLNVCAHSAIARLFILYQFMLLVMRFVSFTFGVLFLVHTAQPKVSADKNDHVHITSVLNSIAAKSSWQLTQKDTLSQIRQIQCNKQASTSIKRQIEREKSKLLNTYDLKILTSALSRFWSFSIFNRFQLQQFPIIV